MLNAQSFWERFRPSAQSEGRCRRFQNWRSHRCFGFSPQRGNPKLAQGKRPAGAPPWVANVTNFEALKGRPYVNSRNCVALSGLGIPANPPTQGVALGWHTIAPLGLKSQQAQLQKLRCGLVSRVHVTRSPRRSGFTLVELISTCVLLGVVFSVSIPLLVTVARERLSAEQRQFALQHATNLLERAVVKDWSELPPGEQTLTAAPSDVVAMLPGLERQLTVTELSEEPHSKQVTVSIRWQGRAGTAVAPLALSAWVYPVQEGQP